MVENIPPTFPLDRGKQKEERFIREGVTEGRERRREEVMEERREREGKRGRKRGREGKEIYYLTKIIYVYLYKFYIHSCVCMTHEWGGGFEFLVILSVKETREDASFTKDRLESQCKKIFY